MDSLFSYNIKLIMLIPTGTIVLPKGAVNQTEVCIVVVGQLLKMDRIIRNNQTSRRYKSTIFR